MKAKAIVLVAFAIGLFAAPQALAAPNGLAVRAAQTACRTELSELGRTAFRATYGRQARRNCVRSHLAEAGEAVRNAAQECRDERRADPAQFALDYGTNRNGRNAFGKCVSGKVREDMAEEAEETINAAQQCRNERRQDPAAFAAEYGSAPSAFGRCVSRKAREADEADEAAEGETPPPPPPAPAP